jgi:eukaryotic-like serine/threonine-protein kinase
MDRHRLVLPPLSAPGEVVTFYSYKGGAGRSMALSNIALLLARRQQASVPVLMIDWDLEAPGLHHYFGQHEERPGVLEFFEACRARLDDLDGADTARDDAALAHQVLAAVDWQDYVVRVDQGCPLYLMRAGRFDAGYRERLARMHWEGLFDACPALFRIFGAGLAQHFRYVLVDSRSGRSDSAGICTTLLPDKLVAQFTPNRQSLEGVEAQVARATDYRRSHEAEQRPLLVYPLPARIEMGDAEQRAQWRRGDPGQGIVGYQPLFERLLRSCYGLAEVALESYFDEVQLQQSKTFACGEQLAARLERSGDRFSLTRAFDAFLGWLGGGYFPWQSRQEIELLEAIGDVRETAAAEGGRALAAARDLNRLGQLYGREGQHARAAGCFERSCALHGGALGAAHPDTLASQGHLARAWCQLNRLAEARALQDTILAGCRSALGDAHAATLAARTELAATLARLGECEAALAQQDRAFEAYLRRLGAEHPLTLQTLAGRAATLFQLGQLEPARALFDEVATARARLLGAEHPDTLDSKEALARALLRLNQPAAARRLLECVAGARERRLGAHHPLTLSTLDCLAEVLAAQGDWIALRALREDLVATRERALGPDHPATLNSARLLAAALAQHGELDAARDLQEQVVQAHERMLGEDHLDTLDSKNQLAGTLWQQGEQDAARLLEDTVLSVSERLLSGACDEGGAREPAAQAWRAGALGLQEAILSMRRQERGAHPAVLAKHLSRVQELLDAEQYRQARELADTLRQPLLAPGVGGKLRKRGIALLKRMYRLQGDKDALLALQEDEVSALEGALSEARVVNR